MSTMCVAPDCTRTKRPGRGHKYCQQCKDAGPHLKSMPACTIASCDRPQQACGWCHTHYEHNRKFGKPERRTERDRFEEKVNRAGPLFGDLGNCWLWLGTGTKTGYGQLWISGRHRYAHRWAYEHFVGPIPEALQIDHLCRRPDCVNPTHMEPVTALVNTQRAAQAITHCPQGHIYDERNTRTDAAGHRDCRACDRAAYHRRKGAQPWPS